MSPSASTGKRCTSYLRGRGVFIYHGKRCELSAGHLDRGQRHETSGSFLDPKQRHLWGRTKGGHA